jgi:hypothetical protein
MTIGCRPGIRATRVLFGHFAISAEAGLLAGRTSATAPDVQYFPGEPVHRSTSTTFIPEALLSLRFRL